MQRVLLAIVMCALLVVSVAIGALAAHWPFWSRALAWSRAPDGWPVSLPGAKLELRSASGLPVLQVAIDPALEQAARESLADVLLLSDGSGEVRAWPDADVRERFDGRGLVQGLLPLLYGALQSERPGLLDETAGRHIGEWSSDPRGQITVRQLLWQTSGLDGTTGSYLNPFSAQAQLASGPDFDRAALAVRQHYPAGSKFEPAAANAQVLATLAARLANDSFARQLESRVWQRIAADPAQAMLDHTRGEMAAHCCFEAAAGDWLRVAMVLAGADHDAGEGRTGATAILPAGFIGEIARDHPVSPGQGLAWRVGHTADGHALLLMAAPGRMLAAVPGTGRALFWAGRGQLPEELVSGLLSGVADSGRSE